MPHDDAQRVELHSLLQEPQRKEVQMFGKTSFEEGLDKGREEGQAQGQRQLLRTLLEARAPLSATARQRLEAWPAEQLTDLAKALFAGKSLRELELED